MNPNTIRLPREIILVTAPIPAITESPYGFACILIMVMERLVSSWKARVGIPIFNISDIISLEKQQFLKRKQNMLLPLIT